MNLFIDALDALDQPYRYCHMFQIIDRKALVFFQMKFEFDRICYFDEQKSVRKLNALTKKGQQLSVAYRNLENLPQLYQASIVKNKELKEQIAAELSIIKKLHLDAKSTVIDAFASEFVIDKNLFWTSRR